jgi:putative isomerase
MKSNQLLRKTIFCYKKFTYSFFGKHWKSDIINNSKIYKMKSVIKFIILIFLLNAPLCCKAQSSKDEPSPYNALQEKICKGWNTWNTNSVLSYVHLPEAFTINLAIKSSGIGRPYLNTFYQANSTLNRPETIKLGKRTDDGQYTELKMVWNADTWRENTQCNIKVQTATDNNDQIILITVNKRDSLRPPHLIIETGVLWNRPNGSIEKKGDKIIARFPDKTFILGTTAKVIDDPFVTCNSPYLAVEMENEIGIFTGKERSLDEIKLIIQKNSNDVDNNRKKYGELTKEFQAMQTILAWNVIYEPEKKRAISPVSRLWSSKWGGYVLFDWDTYFASLMYATYNKELAYANLVEVTRGITPSGFIPNSQSAYNILSVDRSQPPVGSMSALIIYKKYREKWLLEEVYKNLLTWNRWWPKNRDTNGYLCWGSDSVPQNLVDGKSNNWQAAAYESGLDNSPVFDNVPFNSKTHKFELADVGLLSLYIVDCKSLAKISEIIGKPEEAKELLLRAGFYTHSLEKLWQNNTSVYLNKRTDNNQWSNRLSPTNFYPLLARVPTQERAEEIINKHFMNPDEFMGEWLLPSIAKNDSAYNDQSYWRGRIWAPMNFLVYLGLRNYNLPEARKILTEKSMKLMMKSWNEKGAIYENYNSKTGKGDDIITNDAFYHWGALLGLISFMEKGYLPGLE